MSRPAARAVLVLSLLVDVPALPNGLGGLDVWSVFADFLLESGARLGPLISADLSLSESPEPPELEAFQKLARKHCRDRSMTGAEWILGHARTLIIRPMPHTTSHHPFHILDDGLAEAAELLTKPVYSRVETVRVMGAISPHSRMWRRLIARLPPSCRRIDCWGPLVSRVAENELSPQIEELSLLTYDPELVDRLAARLRLLDLRGPLSSASAEHLFEHIGPTVKVVISGFENERVGKLIEGRTSLGEAGDLVLRERQLGATTVIRAAALAQLQAGFGPLGVRTQLSRTLPESWSVLALQSGLFRMHFSGNSFVRRHGGQWSFAPTSNLELPAMASGVVPKTGGVLRHKAAGIEWTVSVNA